MFDEMPEDYGGDEGNGSNAEAMEFVKQTTMSNEFTIQRTVKVTSPNGVETFETLLFVTYRDEAVAIMTNAGRTGVKSGKEPSGNRAPLVDRITVQVVPKETSNSPMSLSEFENHVKSETMRPKVNKFRVITSLTARCLMLVKECPFMLPSTIAAKTLMKSFDDTAYKQFNLAPPPPRKMKLRDMRLLHLMVNKAVVEKFWFEETSVNFQDITLEDGMLKPYSDDQLVDVICALSPDFETTLEAWSWSLEDNPATSADIFHVKNALAFAHGGHLGTGNMLQGSDRYLNNLGMQDGYRGRSSTTMHIEPTLGERGLLSSEMAEKESQYQRIREIRSDLEQRMIHRGALNSTGDKREMPADYVKRIMTDYTQPNGKRMWKSPDTKEVLDVDDVLGAVIPTVAEVVSSGVSIKALDCWLRGTQPLAHEVSFDNKHLGVAHCGWSFHSSDDSKAATASSYNLAWRQLKKAGISKDGDRAPWSAFAKAIKLACGSTQSSKLIISQLTDETVRDALWSIYYPNGTWNNCRIATSSPVMPNKYKSEDAFVQEDGSAIPPGGCLGDIRLNDTSEERWSDWHDHEVSEDGALNYTVISPWLQELYAHDKRPSFTGLSDGFAQRRLDRISVIGRIPTAPPVWNYAEATPIRLSPVDSTPQFNSKAVIDQMSLYIQASMYLSTIPGIKNRRILSDKGNSPKDDIPQNLKCRDLAYNAIPYPSELDADYSRVPKASEIDPDSESHAAMDDAASTASSSHHADMQEETIKMGAVSWSMLQEYLTFKMMDRLGGDNTLSYVEDVMNEFPEAFEGKDTEDVISECIPELTTRFPTYDTEKLKNLSHPIKNGASTVVTEGRRSKDSISEQDIVDFISAGRGRPVAANDPEVLSYTKKLLGHVSLFGTEGSIFNRSAWQEHLFADALQRGAVSGADDACARIIIDSGLCLDTYVTHEMCARKIPGFTNGLSEDYCSLKRGTHRGISIVAQTKASVYSDQGMQEADKHFQAKRNLESINFEQVVSAVRGPRKRTRDA